MNTDVSFFAERGICFRDLYSLQTWERMKRSENRFVPRPHYEDGGDKRFFRQPL